MTKRLPGAIGLVLLLGMGAVMGTVRTQAQQNPAGMVLPATARVQDRFTPLLLGETTLQGGMLGTRIDANAKQRLQNVDENNLLFAFEKRDPKNQAWQGEHVGKFLHAATQAWVYTGDPTLKAKIDRVAARLMKTQEPDGYLGTYPPDRRWTSWDVWVHKYDLLGLLTYYQFTHSAAALQTCRRVGDLLLRTFGTGPGQRDINRAGEHVGMAPDSVLEPVVLLYRATGDPRYLRFAEYIKTNYDAPGGPAILASLEKYRSVRRVANAKAYEMTSNFNGLLELYRATGDKRILDDMRIGWEDIVNHRLYLTGGASSGELFQDDFHLPNGERANICETCVTVTWEQMNLELLRLTGEPQFAEQAERSIYNHLLAAQKPTGDMWAYYTPLEGHKPYGNATNCCLSSGPRGVALIPSFATMTSDDNGLVVNLYNSGTASTRLKSGRVTLTQQTDYPLDGTVRITVGPERNGMRFPLRLRIPAWTTGATLEANWPIDGKPPATKPGTYAVIDRPWRKGDTVTLHIALPTRVVLGDHENEGRAALVRGPLVLALDTALNPEVTNLRGAELASDDAEKLALMPAPTHALQGEAVFSTSGRVAGQETPLYLTPYATAGQDGRSRFEVWVARPGKARIGGPSGSLLFGGRSTASRKGNVEGDIADDDMDTFAVTYNGQRAAEDWFAVTLQKPVVIRRVVYAHGRTFHDGGWFDASAGKPRIQVQTEKNGAWKTVATLDAYPNTTATDAAGLQDGQKFTVSFAPVVAVAVRILGVPACGDRPEQAFSSCAELQAF
jgi:DUF1680 family protein